MDHNGMKAWRCSHNHILGLVVRNGSGIRQLLLYRQAMDEGDLTEAPDVMAIVEGHVMEIRCSICESVRTWVPGEESIRQMLELRIGLPTAEKVVG